MLNNAGLMPHSPLEPVKIDEWHGLDEGDLGLA